MLKWIGNQIDKLYTYMNATLDAILFHCEPPRLGYGMYLVSPLFPVVS